MPSLFIGVTSWNSELFLPTCIEAIRRTTSHLSVELVVLDNCSDDNSQQIVVDAGVELIVKRCTQADALNHLFERSNADYTLLIHSDVVLLNEQWFETCLKNADEKTALISPEDIGCGPMTRPFGIGKPESSFMLFNTELAHGIKQGFSKKRRYLPFLKTIERKVDFYGDHVTHNLPGHIEKQGFNWQSMRVLHSNKLDELRYQPPVITTIWQDSLGDLQYGLGNFYAVGETITHYHNWYDRIDFATLRDQPAATTEANNRGFPLDYIKTYSEL